MSNLPSITRFSQSGNRLELRYSENRLVIRKISSSETVERLHSDYTKLLNWPLQLSFVSTPKILTQWDGFGFDQEYFLGKTLGQFLESCSQSEAHRVSNLICSTLRAQIEYGVVLKDTYMTEEFVKSQISSKINLMRERSAQVENPNRSLLNRALQDGISFLECNLSSVKTLPSLNHGDFSFENILISEVNGSIQLIDLSNTHIDSIVMDISRILIDAEFGWWASARSGVVASRLNSEILKNVVYEFCQSNQLSKLDINFFMILNILRILPYTTKPARLANLLNSLFEILNSNKYLNRGN